MEKTNKTFLIASASAVTIKKFETIIKAHVTPAIIYAAEEGLTATLKYRNVPPNVLITDLQLPKVNGQKLVETVLKDKGKHTTSIIINAAPPKKEQYMDEIVTGQVQFIDETMNEQDIVKAILKALDHAFNVKKDEFCLRFLSAKDLLIKEGDVANLVYIVKKGKLRAFTSKNGTEQTLGFINIGEFVGEMAYISGQNRTANVEAVEECELIEIPIGTFERILYKRPAWAKTMMMTLTKRLQQANEKK